MPNGLLNCYSTDCCFLCFIPPIAQRDLRDLTRHRTNFIRERVNLVNRIQKVLEGANIKLASVVSDVMGVTGRAIFNAIAVGETDPVVMAQLAKGSLCNKRDLLAQSRFWASATSPAIHFGAHSYVNLIA